MAAVTPAASHLILRPPHPPCRLSRFATASGMTPRFATIKCAAAQTSRRYELREGQSRHFHRLTSGQAIEVIAQSPDISSQDFPPLVMVHGSFHAAWCWAEHWMPFFAEHGFHCFAISLLGQGESDGPLEFKAGTLEMHSNTVADFIQKEILSPPVLIGHSFGGLVVQSYISRMMSSSIDQSYFSSEHFSHPKIEAAALVCSVPPSGNSGLVWRYVTTKPVSAIKVTLSLAAKAFSISLPLCKETFFSAQMDDKLVLRYQELMKESSKVPLFDLRKLNSVLPVPSVPKNSMNILVMGASNDFIVDAEGLHETARFYGVDPITVEGVAHDMMLDHSWEKGAEVLLAWLRTLRGI